MEVINYLTRKYGLGGTIFLASVALEGGRFHPEIALPQSQINSNYLQITGIVTPSNMIEGKISERTNRHLSDNLRKNYKKAEKRSPIIKKISTPLPFKSRFNFSDDADENENENNNNKNVPNLLNFGDDEMGGSLTNKKRSKKTNKKRSKKTNKKRSKKTNKKRSKKTNKK
jgi:hypothetical protein